MARRPSPYRVRKALQESFFRDYVCLKPEIIEDVSVALNRLEVPRRPVHPRFLAARAACLQVCQAHRLIQRDGSPSIWFALRLRDEVETFENPQQELPKLPEAVHVAIPAEPEDNSELTNRQWRLRVLRWVRSVRLAFDDAFKQTVGRPATKGKRMKDRGEGRLKELLGKRAVSPPFAWQFAPPRRRSRAKDPSTRALAELFAGVRTRAESGSQATSIRRQCEALGLKGPLKTGRPRKARS